MVAEAMAERRDARVPGDRLGLLEDRLMNKVGLLTGITGQDRAYLADLLLAKGYIVHGVKRREFTYDPCWCALSQRVHWLELGT